MAGKPIQIKGDGTPYRSYLYAADLAIWLWTMLIKGQSGVAYNVGSPDSFPIGQIARTVDQNREFPQGIEIKEKPTHGKAASLYIPNVNLAEEILGLAKPICLADAVRRTISWGR
jgi:dTDP-glucose 4,6-dehydratase